MAKIERNKDDLIKALDKHLILLKEYYVRAFLKGETEFLGEIACKIRLLAIKTRSNTPLLIQLQKATGYEAKFKIDKPGGILSLTLEEYMNSFGCVIKNSDDKLAEFTKKDVIAIYAQQVGGCHEDWNLSDELNRMINDRVLLFGQTPLHNLLGAVCRTVIKIGQDFMEHSK